MSQNTLHQLRFLNIVLIGVLNWSLAMIIPLQGLIKVVLCSRPANPVFLARSTVLWMSKELVHE